MIDYYEYYINDLKVFEKYQNDINFFRNEINSVINYIYSEIEFSRKFWRYDDQGVEVNFNNDLKKFKKNIEKYKTCFVGENIKIKYPERVSDIFVKQYNFLTNLRISDKAINVLYERIREEIFCLDTPPSLKKARSRLETSLKDIIQEMNKSCEKYKQLQNENPKLTHTQILKLLNK